MLFKQWPCFEKRTEKQEIQVDKAPFYSAKAEAIKTY